MSVNIFTVALGIVGENSAGVSSGCSDYSCFLYLVKNVCVLLLFCKVK